MSDQQEPTLRARIKAGHYPQLASKIFDTPLLIQQSKLEVILHVLGPRMGFDVAGGVVEADMAVYNYRNDRSGYQITDNRVAIIPVIGTLIQRADMFSALSGMTSYNQVEHMLARALKDDDIDAVIMDLDTPGGEVAGCFDLCDFIYQSRGDKPIIGMVNELAASGGYAIASSCDKVVVNRTGYTGSIGVVTAHMDVSKAMEARGVAMTYIYAGDHKVDGNPYEPLPKKVKESIQADIDQMYSMFTELVARNRGMDVKDVVATQAAMYLGRDGVNVGLADRVNILQNELSNSALRRGDRNRPKTQTEELKMSDENKTPAGPAAATTEQLDRARAEGKAEGLKEGATAERTRIQGILSHDEARDRIEVAQSFAFETEMSVEQATASLAKIPKMKKEEVKGSALDRHMEKIGSPNVGTTDTDIQEGSGEDLDKEAKAIANFANAGD